MTKDDRRESETETGRGPEGAPEAAAPGNGEGAATAADFQIAELQAALEAKTEEAAANLDRWKREVAEAENFKKRMQRDKQDSIRYANESLLRDVLPVLDNLDWAVSHATGASAETAVLEGVRLTLKLFRDVLERAGAKEIDAAPGTAFDPSLHEAADVQETDEVPANSVLRTQQKGYTLNGRLLRPARVVVAGRSPATDPVLQ